MHITHAHIRQYRQHTQTPQTAQHLFREYKYICPSGLRLKHLALKESSTKTKRYSYIPFSKSKWQPNVRGSMEHTHFHQELYTIDSPFHVQQLYTVPRSAQLDLKNCFRPQKYSSKSVSFDLRKVYPFSRAAKASQV